MGAEYNQFESRWRTPTGRIAKHADDYERQSNQSFLVFISSSVLSESNSNACAIAFLCYFSACKLLITCGLHEVYKFLL